jgi:hypothetical protein
MLITKEMIIGRINKEPSPNIFICGNVIERVSSFRLLGIHIDNNLKWSSHTVYIYSKASSRLIFLKLLKQSGACIDDKLHFFKTVIRSLLGNACPCSLA